ncbi:O-antigen ligase family protein [Alteromonas lipolytica]|uniref:O-antigen ligase-related domain-containing protein n=1 Tax=Alteromonas lipolytica TaxID=1856405 RepID=A0A1E8FAV4_9ALTE|nr:O-antigen ligase family protein [Alteromonas lipolytica]OFI33062.1 hypothetical protein BFC17_01980 [Alteromonas lipolytica]GGF62858.1 hypothetical protein GCM10011338_14110 [Alteromonas lipolytica]
MKLKFSALLGLAFFIIFYTGFQGGRYFMANRVQELGLLMSLSLFLYSALMSAVQIRRADLRWNWWFFATLCFIAYTFFLPAWLFSQNANVPVMPSIMASREFLIIFFGPAIYYLYRMGYDLLTLERVFVYALIFLAFNYLFHYIRLDLVAAYFSSDPTIAGLVTFDPWRGYRLKPSSIALFMLSVLAPVKLVKSRSAAKTLGWFVVVLVVGYIWFLVKARSMAASLILASLVYLLFFLRKQRVGVFFLSIPVIIMLVLTVSMTVAGKLENASSEGDGVRLKSYSIALNSIAEHPFLGFGQQSGYSKTEQDIFWYKFYSADLGLIGTAFKYGLVGAALYIFFSIFIIQRLVRTIWLYRRVYGQVHALLVALSVVFIALFINILLNPALVYIPGLTLAAFSIGLTSAWQHKLRQALLASPAYSA